MQIFALTALTMIAFAANSVLNRMALEVGETGPASFAAVRLISGALMLGVLLVWRNGGIPSARFSIGWAGPLTLALYMLGFSFAYVTLDAGVGALILFGGVQITMFSGAVAAKETIPFNRWAGAAMAFGGLVWLMWPQGAAVPNTTGAVLMVAAAIGWGLYSLNGRKAVDPLSATAVNFVLATPLGLAIWLILPDEMSGQGFGLAVISGMVTSGLGYALWYRVLPKLPAAVAAVAQLTVPVIAMAGGVVFLREVPDMRFVLAAVLVIGGVLVSVGRPTR